MPRSRITAERDSYGQDKGQGIKIVSAKSSVLKAQTIVTHPHEPFINHQDPCILMPMASLSLLLPQSYTHA